MLMAPAGATIAGAPSVASTDAVGALPSAVAAVVGVGPPPPLEAVGVAVAEEPQATKRAAISRNKA